MRIEDRDKKAQVYKSLVEKFKEIDATANFLIFWDSPNFYFYFICLNRS